MNSFDSARVEYKLQCAIGIALLVIAVLAACLCLFCGCAPQPNRVLSEPLMPRAAEFGPPMPRAADLPAPQNLTASDPCVTKWGKPCVTNSNNTYTGKFLIAWDYFANVTGIVFVVRSTNRLDVPVKLWPAVVTPNKFYAVTNMGTAAFFAVSASNTILGTESEFAR